MRILGALLVFSLAFSGSALAKGRQEPAKKQGKEPPKQIRYLKDGKEK